MIAQKFKAQKEKVEEAERNDDSFKHNLMSQMKEQNEKIVSAIMKLLEKVQEERDGGTPIENKGGQKRKGACFICQDPDHYAPDCPNKKEKKPAGTYYQKGVPYNQKGNQAASYFQRGNQEDFNRIRTTQQSLKGNKVATVTTAGQQYTGPPNVPSRISHPLIQNSGTILTTLQTWIQRKCI